MKKILIPTDFSEASVAALKVAIYIAKRRPGVKIRLAHVYHVPRVASLPSDDFGYDVRHQKKQIVEIKEKLQKVAKMEMVKGLAIETQIVPHIDVDQLLTHKDNKDSDLVICGIHGGKDWKRSMENTHVDAILKNAMCPVIFVNEQLTENFKIDDIVFASDFTPEAESVFPEIKKILDFLGARIHLVKVITPDHFENTLHVETQMKEFAKKFYLTNFDIKVFNDENVELGIHRYAYSVNASMIAMETHAHSGFLHYLKKNIMESVAHHTELPVLSIRIPD